jgi:NAD(P)H-dependent FMN reductase
MTHRSPTEYTRHHQALPRTPIPTATPVPSPSSEPVRVTIVVGSVRDGRFSPTVASWVADHVVSSAQVDVELDVVDVVDHVDMDPGAEASLAARLSEADAFLVVVPEYNHSFPGELKTFIDRFRHQWAKKPVGFVSYGGLSGGLRAVEQLRLVFVELSAVPIRDTVSFHGAHQAFDADGQPLDSLGASQALEQTVTQLHWWATALRNARLSHTA